MNSSMLEFAIRMKDLASSGLAKMASNAQKAYSGVMSYADRAKSKNDTLGMSYDAIGKKVRELESTISKSTSVKQIREARNELEKLQRMQNSHAGNSSKGSGGGGGFLSSILPAVGIAGAMALGGSMLTSGLTAQARQASFEVMAGKEKGTSLNKDLTKYAQDSIYGNEVYQNAQTMMGFGIDSSEVLGNTKMLGDVAMGDANKLNSLTLAFSQVSAAGKLTGNDLLQFINAGFNPLQEISKKTGQSIGELKDAMSDGSISFKMVEDAFKSATSEGGRFYQMTDKIAQTDYGKLQAFQGQLEGLSTKIGGMLAPILGNLISNYLAPFVEWLGKAATWIQQNWEWLGLLITVLGTALIVYKGIVLATEAWAAALLLLKSAMLLNPMFLVVAGIAALVAGVIYAWNTFEGFRMVVMGLWESFKQVFTNIGAFFKQTFAPIFEAIEAFKEGRYLDAGKAVAKLAFNLSPVGMAVNATKFAAEGKLTEGVSDAYKKGELKERRKKWFGYNTDESTSSSAPGVTQGATVSDLTAKNGGSETVNGAISGGPRVININGVKFTDKIEIHAQSFEQGMENVASVMDEYLLRILNSASALQ